MVWTRGSTGGVKVTTIVNGRPVETRYPSDTTLGQAIDEEMAKHNLASINVQDEDGNELAPSRSSETLDEVGEVTLIPKSAGA